MESVSRMRSVWVVACGCVLAALASGVGWGQDLVIYDNAFATGWWSPPSWETVGGTINNESLDIGGGNLVIDITHPSDVASEYAVQYHDPNTTDPIPLYPNQYYEIAFDLKPIDSGTGYDRLSIEIGSGGDKRSGVPITHYISATPTVGKVYHVAVPLSDLPPLNEGFTRINWHYSPPEAEPRPTVHYYLDNIRLHYRTDTTAPSVDSLEVKGVFDGGAVLMFQTSKHCLCSITYGPAGQTTQRADEPNYTLKHALYLPICDVTNPGATPQLQPSTTYTFQIVARDHQQDSSVTPNQGSKSGTFTTLASGEPASDTIEFAVDPSQSHAISPLVYGDNYIDHYYSKSTLGRLGGNRWTAYNWENNASNAGVDASFSSDDYLCAHVLSETDAVPGDHEAPGAAVQYRVNQVFKSGAAALVTVPIQGYVARDKSGPVDTNLPIAQHFLQSLSKKSAALSLTPDKTDAFVYQDEFVNWLEKTFFPTGRSNASAALHYSLDNEPDLWYDPSGYGSHSEVQRDPISYDGFTQRSIEFAKMIKNMTPTAKVFGPALAGWYGYTALGGAEGSDSLGDFIDYYLSRFKAAGDSSAAPQRFLDVLDLHWYPEIYVDMSVVAGSKVETARITAASAGYEEVVAARLEAPLSLWDSGYQEDTWIVSSGMDAPGPVKLVNRMLQKIAANYPGTQLSFSEYYYGGGDHISGGVAEADVLGIFGRENVYAAMLWRQGDNAFGYVDGAFDLYRDYDGNNSRFGDTSVAAGPVVSAPADALATNKKASIYASTDSQNPDRMTLVVVNKTFNPINARVTVGGTVLYTHVTAYRLTWANSKPQPAGFSEAVSGNIVTYPMPPISASALVLTTAAVPMYTLTTSVIGGFGTLAPATGAQSQGTVVNLTASPEAGYRVKQWQGTDNDLLKTATNTATMTGDKTVTVEFEPTPTQAYTLTTSVTGGHGTLAPATGPQAQGAAVDLTASPEAGYRVKQWQGTDNDLLKTAMNTVTMTSDKTVTVEFEPIPTQTYTLTTSVTGGHGTLAPAAGSQAQGAVVNLTASPAAGYQVKQWRGTDDDSLKTVTNIVTMNSDKTVTVEFEPVAAQTGTLRVAIQPQAAIDLGASWSIDGGANWNESGSELALPSGSYTIMFNDVTAPDSGCSGPSTKWTTPSPQTVEVSAGAGALANGTYLRAKELFAGAGWPGSTSDGMLMLLTAAMLVVTRKPGWRRQQGI